MRSTDYKECKRNGFTLIETIIVLVVLSIAAVGVLSVFTAGITGSADPLLISQAVHLAQGEIDTIVVEKKQPNGFSLLATGAAACMSPMPGFTCSRNICFVPPADLEDTSACGAPTEYKRAQVTVSWNAGTDSVSIATLVTNH